MMGEMALNLSVPFLGKRARVRVGLRAGVANPD
jgi:hypothetical protein